MMNSQPGPGRSSKQKVKVVQILFLVLLIHGPLIAQSLERLSVDFMEHGQRLPFPLTGGLNSPQFSAVDLNEDGILDLHVFDRIGNRQLTFLNDGSTSEFPYSFAPEYLEPFPFITNWMLLRDYNGDDIMDIFSYSDQTFDAVMVFTGYYENGRIQFRRFNFDAPKNVIYVPRTGGNGSSQLFVSTIDYPAIDDVDCDGDLDVLTFNVVGGYVEFYANQSVEGGFGRDSLLFRLEDNCWGGFFESGVSNEVDLATQAGVCVDNLISGDLEIRHTGSTLLTIDADGDSDKELILGDVSFNNLNYLNNGGSCDQAWMNSQDFNFPSNDVSADVPFFPASFFLDVDNDGLKDLLVAPNVGVGGVDQEIWWYKNIGTATQTSFQLQQKDFLVNKMLDVGSGSRPVFVDYNADGLQDLVIGNYTTFEPFGVKNARLLLYENIGSLTEAKFQLVDDDYLNLHQFSQSAYAFTPSFGDLDGDGDLDALIGEQNGHLFFAKNTAGAGKPFVFQNAQYNYMEINVGQASVPQIIDLDRDGLPDLLVGERNGNINYFQNQGSRTNPLFNTEPDQMVLGGIDTRIFGFTTGYSSPVIIALENDLMLLTGTETGRLELYNNIEGNLNGDFTLVSESFGALQEGVRTHFDVADIDNDGFLELVVGNFSGGISLFQTDMQVQETVPVKEEIAIIDDLQLSPNPANERIRISVEKVIPLGELFIYQANGQLMLQKEWEGLTTNISLESWPSGVYLVQIRAAASLRFKRFIVQ